MNLHGKLKFIPFFTLALISPLLSHAQGMGDSVYSMHKVLENLFEEMLPLCNKLISVGRVIAGFAALWYIASRVWGHIARAEPIDFYPLLRPFGLGIAILLFPYVIAMMNGVLKPVSDATYAMAKNGNEAIRYYVDQQEKQVMDQPERSTAAGTGSPNQWAQYETPTDNSKSTGFLGGVSSYFSLKNMFLGFINQLLQVIYAAAGLAIDTIRTFYMIVLAIIGPLVFGLAVFDGFSSLANFWHKRRRKMRDLLLFHTSIIFFRCSRSRKN